MQDYKKIIFLKAIRVRLAAGEETVDAIISTYPKLTEEEKIELKKAFFERDK